MINPLKKLFDLRLGVLIALCVVTLFLFLGVKLFHTKGEPREALVAQAMIADDNWTLPTTNGVDIAYKPPLFHWSIASISTLTGEVNEYTSRMPSAIAVTVMAIVGYLFYRRRQGSDVAFLASLITLTNFEVHRAATNCRVDMLLAALMVVALYYLYRWYEARLRGVPWVAILCLSGAFLTKGPVGVLLPCVVVAILAWIRGIGFLRILWSMAAVVVGSCVLPMLWYYAAWLQGGEKFLDLVIEENVLRLLGKMTYSSHENPWTYNVMTVVSGFVPYTLLIVLSLFTLKYSRFKVAPMQWWNRFVNYIKTMDDARLFSMLSAVIIFVFYCIPKSKRSVYLLPIYPFVAYSIAEYIIYLVKRKPQSVKWFNTTIATLGIALTLVYVAVACGAVPHSLFSGKHAAQNIAMLDALQSLPAWAYIVVALPLIAGIAYFMCRKRLDAFRLACSGGILTAVLYVALDGAYQPAVLNVKSDLPIAEKLATLAPTGRVYSFIPDNVEGNLLHLFTINFYIGNRMVPFEDFMPAHEGYVVMADRDYDTFVARHGHDYQITPIPNTAHRSCDTRQPSALYHVTHK